MEILPILSALKRNKMGALLVVLQIALTMTIISNVTSVIVSRAALILRPTGTEESDLFAIGYRFTNDDGTLPMLETDLRTLRAANGVVDVVATNTYPLRGSGWREGVSIEPAAKAAQATGGISGVYAMDMHGVTTLGLHLVEGRNFHDDEVFDGHYNSGPMPGVAIISKFLARALFGDAPAVGKLIYLTSDASRPVTVVGVVERLQTATAAGTLDPRESESSVILPIRAAGAGGLFVVRTRPGELEATMRAVQTLLIANNPNRIFGHLRPFGEIRDSAYQEDRSMAVALSVVLIILICVTALGIIGLTSFWVVQRRVQIGVRRALGATRLAIVRYFLVENAMLCLTGVVIGGIASYALNTWLWARYGVDRIPVLELLFCCLMIVLLGQLAALVPAVRAARVAPTEALRSIQ